MIAYIFRRLLQGLLVLILVTIFIFLIMRLLPGDPLMLYIAEKELEGISAADIDALRHKYGLDKPLAIQYFDWIGGVLTGDLGESILQEEKVTTLFKERIPVTLNLGILSILISSTFGITFGLICALQRGKWPDTVFTVIANIGITAPQFWVGILLIYGLAVRLGLLPVYGYTSPFEDFGKSIQHMIMPVICLSLFSLASLTRQARSSTLEVIRQDYIRTAWAKGLRERVIVLRHILKNSLLPVVTMLGMHFGHIIGGSVLIETVFQIPGLGGLMRDAVFSHDYQIVQSGVLIISSIVILCNLIVDISYGWLDPRIKYD